ncbi:MAG: F0F1 ATP synthase subunit alpha, partial [Candidatus Terrybacteria bacterium]|nr:F0F1 ATP synthase subunit alpha [Candidatus Terrybacteria bacterium]
METREILKQLKAEIEKTKLETSVQELGRVLSVRDGVVRISGLSSIGASELLTIRTSAGREVSGLALSLDTSDVGAIIFRGWEEVREGDEAVGTGRV